MRVIAGTARRLPLKTPEGLDTRPTTDRIKETLFNMIQGEIPGCVFVDLFSGSGGIGIEALSRGARHAYFAENAQNAIACIQANLSFTRFEDKATLLKQDAISALSLISEKEVDIIFMDTLIITEAALDRDFSFVEELGFTVVREKKYKTNKHVFCRKVTQ